MLYFYTLIVNLLVHPLSPESRFIYLARSRNPVKPDVPFKRGLSDTSVLINAFKGRFKPISDLPEIKTPFKSRLNAISGTSHNVTQNKKALRNGKLLS